MSAELKNDEHGIAAWYKLDIPAPCFCVWEGTSPPGTVRLKLIPSDRLDSSPGDNFLPVYPGVNLFQFGDHVEPEPVEPEPEPELPPVDPPEEEPPPVVLPVGRIPHTITIYGAAWLTVPMAHWWGDDLVFSVPVEWYEAAWEAGPKRLLERIGDNPD